MSTYKELCALATDLGQPDLIYQFMELAQHQAAINTRRGAAFGVARIAKLSGDSPLMGQHLGALIPKLYRYQYDPNPRVQDAMTHIWRSLVDDPKATVDAHLPQILAELLREMGGRLWRNRQSSCLALCDLIQGRRWEEVNQQFGTIWIMTMRTMDDIKESVRQAGITLCKGVRQLTLRLVDTDYSTRKDAQEAVAVVLPILLEKGLSSQVKEVQALAIDTICKVAKAAGPAQLQPVLPQLVTAMLESLSSSEDARLNYIEQHAERMGLDQDRLEGVRVSASRASPMGETLDLCVKYMQPATLTSVLPEVTALVKRGVGLNTKVGTGRFIRSLIVRLGSDLKELNQVGPLMKTLTAAVKNERSNTIRRTYAAALAELTKYAGDKRMEKFIGDMVEAYGGEGDVDARLYSGMVLRELLKVAPDVFQKWSGAILPTAFAAKADDDGEVAKVWGEIWEEGVTSERAALRLYLTELVEVVVTGLTAQQWGRRKTAAEALLQLCDKVGSPQLDDHAQRLVQILISEIPGRLWDGKERFLEALGALCQATSSALKDKVDRGNIIDTIISAAQRKKSSYRLAALKCLEQAISAFQLDVYDKVADILLAAITSHSSPPPPKSEGAAEEVEEKPLPLLECLNCLTATLQCTDIIVLQREIGRVGEVLAALLKAGGVPWAAVQSSCKAVQILVERVSVDDLISGHHMAPWVAPLLSGLCRSYMSSKVTQSQTSLLSVILTLLHKWRLAVGSDGDMWAGHQEVRSELLEVVNLTQTVTDNPTLTKRGQEVGSFLKE